MMYTVIRRVCQGTHADDETPCGQMGLRPQRSRRSDHAPLTLTVGVDNLLDETYRDFLDTYKGYALSPGRDVRFGLSTLF